MNILFDITTDFTRGFDLMLFLEYIVAPLAITFVLATLIGIERQNIGKAAGLSSHVLVAIGACGIAVMQLLMFKEGLVSRGETNPNGQQRVIAQVVSGVGFIGAGVIIKDKLSIKGITTAATIWVVAMIGLIMGSGYTITGVTMGVLVVLFLYVRDITRGINPFKSIDDQLQKKSSAAHKFNDNGDVKKEDSDETDGE